MAARLPDIWRQRYNDLNTRLHCKNSIANDFDGQRIYSQVSIGTVSLWPTRNFLGHTHFSRSLDGNSFPSGTGSIGGPPVTTINAHPVTITLNCRHFSRQQWGSDLFGSLHGAYSSFLDLDVYHAMKLGLTSYFQNVTPSFDAQFPWETHPTLHNTTNQQTTLGWDQFIRGNSILMPNALILWMSPQIGKLALFKCSQISCSGCGNYATDVVTVLTMPPKHRLNKNKHNVNSGVSMNSSDGSSNRINIYFMTTPISIYLNHSHNNVHGSPTTKSCLSTAQNLQQHRPSFALNNSRLSFFLLEPCSRRSRSLNPTQHGALTSHVWQTILRLVLCLAQRFELAALRPKLPSSICPHFPIFMPKPCPPNHSCPPLTKILPATQQHHNNV
jgi:hypothetical protein